MSNLESKSKQCEFILTREDNSFNNKYIWIFILASLLIHGILFFTIDVKPKSKLNDKNKISHKPIEFVTISSPENKEKPPKNTEKRAIENFIAKQDIKTRKTAASPEINDRITAKKAANPSPTTQPIIPKSTPIPPTKSESPKPPQKKVISGSDAPIPSPKPNSAKLNTSNSSVATRLPSPSKPKPQKSVPQSKSPNSNSTGAASLLGGNYKRTLASGGGDDFFSPEALTQQTALNPNNLNALKDENLSQYFAEIKRRVKRNWNPSQAIEEYTTELTFDIQEDGQITGLRVVKSSGSMKVDSESVAAVQNSAPFPPLPSSYSAKVLEVEFGFNIYIY